MTFARILRFCVTLPALCLALPAAAVTPAGRQPRLPFLFDITTFTTSLSLPVEDKVETVRISEAQMLTRIERSLKDETVEPLTLLMSEDEAGVAAMAERLALEGRQDQLIDYFRRALKAAKPVKKGSSIKTVVIDRKGFDLIDKTSFADLFSRAHHNLTLDTTELKKNRELRTELLRQVTPFFKKEERKAMLERIMKGEPIVVDRQLLPEFAQKMVKKYIIYRGPNCFHAALAFHSPVMTSSSMINVKEETGYHRAMINYDELWRAINRNFYEINPDKQPLKFGDMLVFFEVPEEAEEDLERPVEFRWIRHTATYLFSGYTFSKGSKSPNTPYTVRTLAEEWKTWKRYTRNLGVKVFRRSQKQVKLQPPVDLTDWMY